MQHVNDDMDELFRKAGEEYPLHAGAPDWEKVASALQQAPPESERKDKKLGLLWLLLLLPIAFVCNHYWMQGTQPKEPGAQQKAETVIIPNQQQENNTTVSILPYGKNNKLGEPAENNREIKVEEQYQTEVVKEKSRQKSYAASKPARTDRFIQATMHADPVVRSKAFAQHLVAAEKETSSERNSAPDVIVPDAVSLLKNEDIPDQLQTGLHPSNFFDVVHHQLAADSLLQPDKLSAPYSTSQRRRSFYVGVVGSADLTSVRLQRTSNVGWQAGILAGYRWHHRWSVETGLSISRKFYYTKGEYFNKSRTYLPPNSKIMEVDGYCTMLEIPVNLKVDLVQRTSHSWFAVAGLTSYIMKKEAYDFLYYYTNTGNYATYGKSYANASNNLFSVLQVSGGYTRNLKGSFALRVEPYLKLPLTGLGYGKLHFSSTGMHIGVVKKL